jgi:hypothetical protein
LLRTYRHACRDDIAVLLVLRVRWVGFLSQADGTAPAKCLGSFGELDTLSRIATTSSVVDWMRILAGTCVFAYGHV